MTRFAKWTGFWIGAGAFYIWFFSRSSGGPADVLHIALPLLAIAMGTSWLLGWVLVPRFLLQDRRGLFALYTLYTITVSAYLVLAVIVGAFMLADYTVRDMAPAALDRPGLFIGVYVVVATALLVRLLGDWEAASKERDRVDADRRLAEERLRAAERALEQAEKAEPDWIDLAVDRKTVRVSIDEISYLESAGDYVLVHTAQERLITKARLGDLADRLGPAFQRTHRSFVVRLGAVTGFSSSALTAGDSEIPIGRTYRRATRDALGG